MDRLLRNGDAVLCIFLCWYRTLSNLVEARWFKATIGRVGSHVQ